jgi:type II secretory pathway pseudopilin PulG
MQRNGPHGSGPGFGLHSAAETNRLRARQTNRSTADLPEFQHADWRCDGPFRAAWRGFTRIELLVVLATLCLITTLALPLLANNRERSLRVLCVNNLRLAGQAMHQWSTEQSGRMPWRTPWCEGGTFPASCSGSPPAWVSGGLNNNLWFQWAWLSNELQSPKILLCPSDISKRSANTWSGSPDGGFLHPNYRNGSVSYFIGLDVFPESRSSLLAGDRNVIFDLPNQSCSSRITVTQGLGFGPAAGIGAGMHVAEGNFLFTDGRVDELSSGGFVKSGRDTFSRIDDNGTSHYLPPYP